MTEKNKAAQEMADMRWAGTTKKERSKAGIMAAKGRWKGHKAARPAKLRNGYKKPIGYNE